MIQIAFLFTFISGAVRALDSGRPRKLAERACGSTYVRPGIKLAGDAMDRSRWVLVLEQLVGWYEMGVNRDRF